MRSARAFWSGVQVRVSVSGVCWVVESGDEDGAPVGVELLELFEDDCVLGWGWPDFTFWRNSSACLVWEGMMERLI